ncbi:MAG TPA: DUF3347 domain-containing protein [Chitinophagaceae bacterium]|nr:DUF3347 domain-containing protein [Chitinophagaceae bacterium]
MKRFLLLVAVLALAVLAVWFFMFKGKMMSVSGPGPQPLAVSKHSPAFNASAQRMMEAYYGLSEAFVNWDTAAVTRQAAALKEALDSLKLEELHHDTLIYETALGPWGDAKAETAGLIQDPSLDEKRLSFNTLTQHLYDLLRTVRFDLAKVYFQECPMAFGEDKPGNWLSSTREVRNPYLGNRHPKFKESMLHCGNPKDTLDFLASDSTKH